MEEKIQSVQYRDSEPSEFAHKPPKQEMDLSCSPGRLSPIGRSHRLDSVELGVIHIVASSFSALVAFAHVIEVFMSHHDAAKPLKVLWENLLREHVSHLECARGL